MKSFTFLSCVGFLASSVVGGYYITQPIDGTRWVTGTNVTVSWIENDQPVASDKLDITLMFGKAENLQEVTTLVKGISGKAGTYKWNVPLRVPSGSQYAIRVGSGSDAYYSHYFDVEASKSSPTSDKSTATNSISVNNASSSLSPKETTSNTKSTVTLSNVSTKPSSSPAVNVANTPDSPGKVPTAVSGSIAKYGTVTFITLVPAILISYLGC